MENFEALIFLNLIRGLSPTKIKRLLEHFKSPKDILRANISELKTVEGINENLTRRIKSDPKDAGLEEELRGIKKSDIRVISILDAAYPKNLKEIYDPPVVLYIKGALKESDDISLSIVGTRAPSYYGLSQAEKFSYQLALRGVTIVSGMARGIDSAAHNGSVKAKGKTIAVLGSGLSVIYPPENKDLFDKISQSGAIISEFPMETPPDRENFPRRNRIISGLSLGTLVIEAARNSGSLITAGFALEQGREVFAIPGNVSSKGSFGTNRLIKEGAKLVEDIEDIIEEIEPFKRVVKKNAQGETKKINSRLDPSLRGTGMVYPLGLDADERLFFDSLSSDNPLHIDNIAAGLKCPANKLLAMAMKLELAGLIKQLPGKFFVRN